MAMNAEDVRRQALELPDGERAELAAELLASLDELPRGADEGHREAWAAELERRARSVVNGESDTTAWDSARETIVDELTG